MRVTRSYHGHSDAILLEEVNFLRKRLIEGVTMAEQAILPIAPREYSALTRQSEGVLPAACYLSYLDFNQSFYWSWKRVVLSVAMPKLSEYPATPCQNHPILAYSSRVMIPACQLLEPVLAVYLTGHFLVAVFAGPAPAILARAPHVALVAHYPSDIHRLPGLLG